MLNPVNRKNLKSTVGYLLLNRLRTGKNSDYKKSWVSRGSMNEIEKYRILSAGKAFGHRAQIALLLLDSSTAYEELKEEAAQTSVAGSYGCAGGFPSEILERITLLCCCSHKVVAVDFHTLYYGAERRGYETLRTNQFELKDEFDER